MAAQTRRGLIHPVFTGSAGRGVGVDTLLAGIASFLPSGDGDADAPVSGRVFKIERTASGERVAYVRLFAGTLRPHAGLAHQAVRLHVTTHGRIRAQQPQRRLGLEQRRQVVVVQLVAPMRMFVVLAAEPFGHRGRHCRTTSPAGAFVLQAGNLMQTDQLLAGVVILSLFGLAVGKLINWLEARLLHWR